MNDVVLHIGMPKTGTTSMQVIFENSERLRCIGRFGKGGHGFLDDTARDLLWSGIFLPSNFWMRRREQFKSYIDEQKRLAKAEGKVLVVSNEALSVPHYHSKVDQAEVMRRLHYLFGDSATPLLLIRNQMSWFKSYYSSFVIDSASSLSFGEFFESSMDPLCMFSHANDLDYCALHQLLTSLFKEVRIMPFESVFNSGGLKETDARWLEETLELTSEKLAGETNNQRRDADHISYARAYNEFFKVGLCNSIENYPTHIHSVRGRELLEKGKAQKKHGLSANEVREADELASFYQHHITHYSDPKVLQKICRKRRIKPKKSEDYPTLAHSQMVSKVYGEGNRSLAQTIGYDLAALGYTCE